jgi:hypothetical protein
MIVASEQIKYQHKEIIIDMQQDENYCYKLNDNEARAVNGTKLLPDLSY